MLRLLAFLASLVFAVPQAAASPDPKDWDAVVKAARGQVVHFNAWGGSARTNDFLQWTAAQVLERYAVTLRHVKLTDTADAVARVVAEKAAGRDVGGAVDLVWINGANFASMKANGLLFGPFAEDLPNWRFADVQGKPLTTDFTVPTEGYESPWMTAQIVFYFDTAVIDTPPRSMAALLDWAKANPGRFTYPQPPNFLGVTFLKQALYELIDDPEALLAPIDEAQYGAQTGAFWRFLDELNPQLWRAGRAFPPNDSRQIQLMADGEIALAVSLNPNIASRAIADGELPDTIRTFVPEGGSIGNASFVAIPYNAAAKEGALVIANFLMSPEAQLRQSDPEVWGIGTVLAMDLLEPEDLARFEALERGIATLSPAELGAMLPEPHPDWMTRIEAEWARRYGVAQ